MFIKRIFLIVFLFASAYAMEGGSGAAGPADAPICAICRDSLFLPGAVTEIVTASCGHSFHYECLEVWFREHRICPLCRKKEILTFVSPLQRLHLENEGLRKRLDDLRHREREERENVISACSSLSQEVLSHNCFMGSTMWGGALSGASISAILSGMFKGDLKSIVIVHTIVLSLALVRSLHLFPALLNRFDLLSSSRKIAQAECLVRRNDFGPNYENPTTVLAQAHADNIAHKTLDNFCLGVCFSFFTIFLTLLILNK